MDTLSTSFIVAIGGAGMLAALAFRQLTATVIQLNQELRLAIEERKVGETERATLKQRIDDLEDHIDQMEARIEAQAEEIHTLQRQLGERDRLIAHLQTRPTP
jgi:predicted  nucleic acid-binding Zn-ribbon protein